MYDNDFFGGGKMEMSNKDKIRVKARWEVARGVSIINATYVEALRYMEYLRRMGRTDTHKPVCLF